MCEGYWGGRGCEGVGYKWDIEGLVRHGRGSTEDVRCRICDALDILCSSMRAMDEKRHKLPSGTTGSTTTSVEYYTIMKTARTPTR